MSLEQDVFVMKVFGCRVEVQIDLNNKWEVFNFLFERFEDLKQVGKIVFGIECVVVNFDFVGCY